MVAKLTEGAEETKIEERKVSGLKVLVISIPCPLSWEIYVDGAANQKGFGVGIVLVSPKKITMEKSLRLGFSAINNEAKYEALLVGMTMVKRLVRKAVKTFSDLRLVE